MDKKYRVFDTNVFSTHKNHLTVQDYEKMALSLVVFYELTATKITRAKRRTWDSLIRRHYEAKTLIVPSLDDWKIASHIVWLMHQNNEPLPKDAAALQNDVLICVSTLSFSENVPVIITENLKHFQVIARYLNRRNIREGQRLVVESAKDYFS